MSPISNVAIDTAIWASHYNLIVNALNRAPIHFLSNSAISAYDMTGISWELPGIVKDEGVYFYDPSSTETADGYFIIQPPGGGRWYLSNPHNFSGYARKVESVESWTPIDSSSEGMFKITYDAYLSGADIELKVDDVVVATLSSTGKNYLLENGSKFEVDAIDVGSGGLLFASADTSKNFTGTISTSDRHAAAFGNSGSYFYRTEGRTIHRHAVSTAFEIDTAGASAESLDLSTVGFSDISSTDDISGIAFNSAGTVAVIGYSYYSSGFYYPRIRSLPLSTPWILSSAGTASAYVELDSSPATMRGWCMNSDGTRGYYTINGSNIRQANFSTGFDLSTYSDPSKTYTPGDTSFGGIAVHSNDEHIIYSEGSTDKLYQILMSSAGDLSTASADDDYDIANVSTHAVLINNDGSKIYYMQVTTNNHDVYQLEAPPNFGGHVKVFVEFIR